MAFSTAHSFGDFYAGWPPRLLVVLSHATLWFIAEMGFPFATDPCHECYLSGQAPDAWRS